MVCPKCGTKCEDDALFCSKCGERLGTERNRANITDGVAEVLNSTDPENAFIRRFSWLWLLRGRSTRKEFLIVNLLSIIAVYWFVHGLMVKLGLVDLGEFNSVDDGDFGPPFVEWMANAASLLGSCACLAGAVWAFIAAFARRLHDTGRSGLPLWGLVPLGCIVFPAFPQIVGNLFNSSSGKAAEAVMSQPSDVIAAIKGFLSGSLLWFNGFAVLVGGIWFLILWSFAATCDGTQGENMFGPDPNAKPHAAGRLGIAIEKFFSSVCSILRNTFEKLIGDDAPAPCQFLYKKFNGNDARSRTKVLLVSIATVFVSISLFLGIKGAWRSVSDNRAEASMYSLDLNAGSLK